MSRTIEQTAQFLLLRMDAAIVSGYVSANTQSSQELFGGSHQRCLRGAAISFVIWMSSKQNVAMAARTRVVSR